MFELIDSGNADSQILGFLGQAWKPRAFSWITMVARLGGRSCKDKANDRHNDKKKKPSPKMRTSRSSTIDEEMNYAEHDRARYGKHRPEWYDCPMCGAWHTNSEKWTWKNTSLGWVQVCEKCTPLC